MYDEDDSEENGFLLCVKLPDLKSQTRIVVRRNQTVYSAKQALLSKITGHLPYDSLNYGLYLRPTGPGRPGKFLDDGRQLSEYEMSSTSNIEFLYKKRDYTLCPNLTSKAISKANSKSNQKKLMDHVAHGSVKKIEKLLDTGVDPNFIFDDGNTPLGAACGRNGKVDCIPPLLSRGAHIDFRGSGGLTPIHRAAIGGNAQAVRNLLSLGSSPNYTDEKEMTPIYHAAIMGDDVSVTEALLKHKAMIGQADQIGWTELHQIAKHGNTHLIDIMLLYGADIDAQNDTGNTPLHVAAQHGQTNAALHLMKRGADRDIANASGQPPNQVAILCGHRLLAKEVLNFTNRDKEPLKRQLSSKKSVKPAETMKPLNSYSSKTLPSKGRKGNRSDFMTERQKWSQPVSHSYLTDDIVSLSQDDEEIEEIEPVHLSTGSSSSGSQSGTPQRHRYSDSRRIKNSSVSTTLPPSSPRKRSPAPQPPRERLYACTPGKKYTVTRDVSPQQLGDLVLVKGQAIEVLYIGKGNFWEGKINDKQGWFPRNAITATADEPPSSNNNSTQKRSNNQEMNNTTPSSSSSDQALKKVEDVDSKSSSSKQQPKAKSTDNLKRITVRRGPGGYGFAMRGVKTVNIETFKPNENVPALQYVGNVDEGGAADTAGLKQGDFIIEVNGVDTTCATHHKVVSIIKEAEGTLRMKIKSKTQAKLDGSVVKSETSATTTKSTIQNETKIKAEATKAHEIQKKSDISSQKTSKDSEKIKNSQTESKNDEEHIVEKASSMSSSPQPSAATGTKTSPKAMSNSSSRKGKTDSPSPLLHSISYKGNTRKEGESPSPSFTHDEHGSTNSLSTEDMEKKETEELEKHLKDSEDEEELSGFAKELRYASLNRHNRLSTKNNQTTSSAERNTTGKEQQKEESKDEPVKKTSPSSSSVLAGKETEIHKREETRADDANKGSSAQSSTDKESSKQYAEQQEKLKNSPLLKQVLPRKRSTGSEPTATSNKPKMDQLPPWSNNGNNGGGAVDDSSDEDSGWTEVEVESSNMRDFKSSGYGKEGSNSSSPSNKKPANTIMEEHKSPNLATNPKGLYDKGRDETSRASPKQGTAGRVTPSSSGQKQYGSPLSAREKVSSDNIISNKKLIYSESKDTTKSNSSELKHITKSSSSESKDSHKNHVKGSSQKSKAPPPPIAKKPKPLSPPPKATVEQKSPTKETKQDDDTDKVSLPVTSLRSKFETMSKTPPSNTSTKPKTTKAATTSPMSPKSKAVKSDYVELKKVSQTPSKDQTPLSKDKNTGGMQPPKGLPPPIAADSADILPPPLSISDDEADITEDFGDFPPPPLPPVMMDNSDSDDDLSADVAPPPPLYDDMDDEDLFDEDLFDDNPPIQDVPVSLSKLLVTDDSFEPHPPPPDAQEDQPDLLQDIVGQLQTLVTTDPRGSNSDEGSEDSDDVPPPLPTSPPPSMAEDTEQVSDGPPPVIQPHPPTDDTVPPPVDLPPPQDISLDDTLGSTEEDSLLIPPPDEVPPPIFDNDDLETSEDLDILPPPPDALVPPPADILPPDALLPPPSDDILPPPADDLDDDNISLPPAPLMYDEEEDEIIDDLLPPPLDLPPPSVEDDSHDHIVNPNTTEGQDQQVPVAESFDSKPLDSWSVDDVCQWLTEVGLDSHIPTFRDNEIIGEHLRDLSREDLKDLGISKIGHIKTFKQKLEPYLST